MTPRHIRDMVMRAAAERSGNTMDLLVAQLVDAARAREILRAKGYGGTGMSASATAAQVPSAFRSYAKGGVVNGMRLVGESDPGFELMFERLV